MTYDEMKKTLDSLWQKKRLLRSVQRQLEEAREQVDCLSGVNYEKVAVQGGEKIPAAERFIEHIERLEDRYEEVMSEVFAIEDMISAHLSDLTDIEQAIIIDRYMLRKSWRKIQQEHNYEERQPYRIAESAIKKLALGRKDDSK